MTSRTERREKWDMPTHMAEAEYDLDNFEARLTKAVEGMRAASNRMLYSVVGVLFTVVAGLIIAIVTAPK